MNYLNELAIKGIEAHLKVFSVAQERLTVYDFEWAFANRSLLDVLDFHQVFVAQGAAGLYNVLNTAGRDELCKLLSTPPDTWGRDDKSHLTYRNIDAIVLRKVHGFEPTVSEIDAVKAFFAEHSNGIDPVNKCLLTNYLIAKRHFPDEHREVEEFNKSKGEL